MTSRGVVYVDGDRYKLRLPPNWTVHQEPAHLGLQGSMQWCYRQFPDATSYGWLADDTRPRTAGWDVQLEQAAGAWNLAYASDNWISNDQTGRDRLQTGHDLSSGLCFGGDLVRAVGWWALPGVFQAGIDTAWTEIVRPWNLHRYVADVLVEHRHWRDNARPKDSLDDAAWIDLDLTVRDRWGWSRGYRDALQRAGNGAEPTGAIRDALRMSRVNELWAHSDGKTPAARLLRMMEGAYDGFDPDTDQEPAGLDTQMRAVRHEPDVRRLGVGCLRQRERDS